MISKGFTELVPPLFGYSIQESGPLHLTWAATATAQLAVVAGAQVN